VRKPDLLQQNVNLISQCQKCRNCCQVFCPWTRRKI